MSRPPCLLLPVFACSTLLLTGALNHQATPSAPLASPGGVDALDPSGVPGGADLLDAAAGAFAPERVPWLEMTLWQRVHCDDFTYEAHGRYISAPGPRLRLDLEVCVGQTRGELRMVRNGGTVDYCYRRDHEAPTRIRVPDQLAAEQPASGAPSVAPIPDVLLQDKDWPGMVPLLRMIRERLLAPRRITGRWKGKDVIQVTGQWCPDAGSLTGVPADALPTLQPRLCRVFIDTRTLWPHRIEWWGSASPQKRNMLLMQVEYRQPVLNQPLTPERCAREFALTPEERGR